MKRIYHKVVIKRNWKWIVYVGGMVNITLITTLIFGGFNLYLRTGSNQIFLIIWSVGCTFGLTLLNYYMWLDLKEIKIEKVEHMIKEVRKWKK